MPGDWCGKEERQTTALADQMRCHWEQSPPHRRWQNYISATRASSYPYFQGFYSSMGQSYGDCEVQLWKSRRLGLPEMDFRRNEVLSALF